MALLPRLAIPLDGPRAISRVVRHAGLFAFSHLLVTADIRAEGRVRDDDIEPLAEDAVYVHQTIMVVDAAVPIAVHNHVHLGRARGARLGIATEDTVPCEASKPRVHGLVFVR